MTAGRHSSKENQGVKRTLFFHTQKKNLQLLWGKLSISKNLKKNRLASSPLEYALELHVWRHDLQQKVPSVWKVDNFSTLGLEH